MRADSLVSDPPPRRRAPRRIVLLAPLLLLALPLLVAVTLDSARLLSDPFPGFLLWDNGKLAAFHMDAWTGPRAGLPLNGGRILAVDGRPFVSGAALMARVADEPLGTGFLYRVEQGGVASDFDVPTMQLDASGYAGTFGNYLANAAVFFALAILAIVLRPDLPAARALAIVMGILGLVLTLAVDFIASYRFTILYPLVQALMPAAIANFALIFPIERVTPRRRAWIVFAIAFITLLVAVSEILLFHSDPVAVERLDRTVYVLFSVISLAMLVSLGDALFRARSPESRLQAAVVFAGALAAFLLPAIAILVFVLLGWSFSFTWVTALFAFFPISVLYAVVRHDLLAAERFVRLTVGYVVATSVVVLAYAVGLGTLDRLLAQGAASSPAANFVLLLLLAVSFDPLRRWVQTAVDRAFFRSTVDAASILEESSTSLALLPDVEAVARTVEDLLQRALSLEWVVLDTSDAAHSDAAISESVHFRAERLGVLAGGSKRSGAPFSAAERDLVRGLAAQAGLALRNLGSIQALREAQSALLRSERLAAIGEFAGAVAHGIRNPLAGIRAAMQNARECSGDPAMEESLSSALSEVDRLEQRMRSLLDFSRPFEPKTSVVDVRALMEAVARTLRSRAERQQVEIRIEGPASGPSVHTDPDFLEEVLLELAGNALRYMPTGGTLGFQATSSGGPTTLRISDTGPGVPAGVRDRVFELFFTTRADGTGLGLAMVKKIVERQGGSVSLESSGPSGTVFRIDLP